jgi:MFS family permease
MQGLLPDRVPQEQLGVASSVKTFMDMLTLILASVLAGRLIDPVTRDPTPTMLVVMGLLAAAAAITIFGVREEPTTVRAAQSPRRVRTLSEGEAGKREKGRMGSRVKFSENPAYWWLIAERLVFLIGIYGMQSFAQYYLQDVLQVPDPPAQTGNLLAALTIPLVVLVLLGGWLTDKYGAKRILAIATIVSGTGLFLMLFATDMRGLLILGSLFGAGIGLFLTSNWALANSLAPQQEAGKYLGLTNLATAGSAAIARLEGPALDWLNASWPGAWIGYKGLFVFGALCIFLSIFLLQKISENPNTKVSRVDLAR